MKNTTRYRIIEILELFAGSVLPIIFWLSVIFGFDAPYFAVLTIISAVIHEIGHGIAISALSEKAGKLRGHSTGFRIKENSLISYPREIAVMLAGPLSNILIFLLTLPFGNAFFGYARALGFINLATGLSNLLPLEGYDGYGALLTLLKSRGAQRHIQRLEEISFVFSILLTFVSLHIIDKFGEGYWIFGLFFFATLSKIIKFGKYDIFRE